MRSIRRTRTREMTMELKRDKECKDTAYKSLAEEVLGKWDEVKALKKTLHRLQPEVVQTEQART